MTVVALLISAREMGGKIVRSGGGGFVVQGVEESRLNHGILDALAAHRAELDLIESSPTPLPTIDATPTETPSDASSVAEPLPWCSCGAPVGRQRDELCRSCCKAALAAI
jgi:hypothetical protein